MLAACSDNPVNPSKPSLITVSGTVTVWDCPGWSPIYNYTEYTGKPATVTLTGSDGIAHVATTDPHSRFSFSLDSGLYSITLSTFHMQPETYGYLYVERDTGNMELRSVLAYSPSDAMTAYFYHSTGDTVNVEQFERETLAYLSDQMHGVIDVRQAVRQVSPSNNGWVYYADIRVRADVPAWRARLIAEEIMQYNSSHFPAGFSIFANYYPCLS